MTGRVISCVIVTEIFRAGPPKDSELSLLFAIFEPIAAHAHCFGQFLFDGTIVDNTHGCIAIGL